jgi:hypothetical protein
MDTETGTLMGALNLARYCVFLAEHAPGGDFEERDGFVLFAGAHPYPGSHTNGVMRTSSDLPPEELLAQADQWFRRKKRGYTVWTRGELDADLDRMVNARGLLRRPPENGMAYMLIDRPMPEAEFTVPDGAAVRKVIDEAGGHDYLKVVAEAFDIAGLPTTTVGQLFFDPLTLLDESCAGYVAYVEGEPVAACLMWYDVRGFAGTYAGVSSPSSLRHPVVFREAARGRGLAKICLCRALNDGFEMGARFGGGTATPDGQAAWGAMGFQTTSVFQRYIRRPPF